MTMVDISGDLLALAGCAALAFLLGAVTVSWRMKGQLQRLECSLQALAPETLALRSELAGLGAAVTTLSLRFDRLSSQLAVDARHSSTAGSGDRRELDLAVRGARQGASEDDLVADYGMSRQEAAFLRRLHAAAPSAAERRAIA